MKEYVYDLPAYWHEHVQEKICEIKALQAEKDAEITCFGMITDYHWYGNQNYSVAILERILDECDIPYYFCAGDIVSGAGTCEPEFIYTEIAGFVKLFAPIERKGLYAEGNHDRAYCTFEPPIYYAENITKADFNSRYFSVQKKYSDRVFGDDSYYYVDNNATKTRFIVLNSQDVPNEEKTVEGYAKYNVLRHFGFRQAQVEWLATVALRVPSSDWSVVLCSHACYFESKNGPDSYYNYQAVAGIIDAFIKGTKYEIKTRYENTLYNVDISVDFEDKSANFIAWVSGHTHKDVINIVNGIVCVSTTTDAGYVYDIPEKAGTIREQAFDIFVVNKKTRQANIVRIGNGENRTFKY